MSSYYPSFSYLGVNSRDKGLIVSHFDADHGESDTFLGMEPIYTESSDGSRRLDYGARYSNVAVFRITVIKEDGGDFSVKEVRDNLRWLTGAKSNSSLDLFENFVENFVGDGATTSFELINTCDHIARVYVGGVVLDNSKWTYNRASNSIKLTDMPNNGVTVKVAYGRIKYSFICRVTNAWQYKLDARTTGLVLEFTSVSPWAYSAKQVVSTLVNGSTTLTINNASDDLYGYTPVNVTFYNNSQLRVNLLRGTQFWDSTYWKKTSDKTIDGETISIDASSLESGYTEVYQTVYLTAGKTYTLSVDFVEQIATASGIVVHIFAYDNTARQTNNAIYKLKPSVGKHSGTFTVPEGSSSFTVYVRAYAGVGFKVKHIQLEEGDKATTWSQHPKDSATLKVLNTTTGDTTMVNNMGFREIVSISDNMMITSDKSNKIFGNDFNFVFPRLCAGENKLIVTGTGTITFEYVYAIKVGDCAMDITVISDPICNDDGEIILDMLPFSRISDLPNNFQAYNIQNVYSKADVDALVAGIEIDEAELSKMLVEELN